MKRIFLMFLTMSVSVSIGFAEDMVSEQINRDTKNDPVANFELAMSEREEMTAKCYFGLYLSVAENLTADSEISNMISFAQKKGMLHEAAFLISCSGDSSQFADAFIGKGENDLAASVLAFEAFATYYHDEKTALLKQVSVEGESDLKSKGGAAKKGASAKKGKKGAGGKGKAGKGGKNQKESAAKAETVAVSTLDIPDILFEDRNKETVELAIIAAAYAGDSTAKGAIDAVRVSGRVAGGKLLYYARTGVAVTDAMVADAFKKSPSSAANTITKVSPQLAGFNLLVPGEAMACEAVGIIGDEKYLPYLHNAMTHRDIRVRIEAVRAVAKIGSETSLKPVAQAILKSDWPVLVEACDAAGRIPHKNMIPVLINRLEAEKGRLRLDITKALSCIAGEQAKRRDAKDWKAWWAKEGSAFAVDKAKSEAFRTSHRIQQTDVPALGFFYGLSIYSDRFSYVIDTSMSMKGGRIKSLRENLDSSINSLKSWCRFNITDFGGIVAMIDSKMLISSKDKAMKRGQDMPLTWGTRSYDAIEAAMSLPQLDTIYFLSDGAPVLGQLNKWPQIIRGMTVMTRYMPVTISCVTFDPKAGHKAGMKQMSFENTGEQEDVEI